MCHLYPYTNVKLLWKFFYIKKKSVVNCNYTMTSYSVVSVPLLKLSGNEDMKSEDAVKFEIITITIMTRFTLSNPTEYSFIKKITKRT